MTTVSNPETEMWTETNETRGQIQHRREEEVVHRAPHSSDHFFFFFACFDRNRWAFVDIGSDRRERTGVVYTLICNKTIDRKLCGGHFVIVS